MSSPSTESPILTLDADQRIDMPHVGWEVYRTLDRSRGGKANPRLLYLDGRLTLVSPSRIHEYSSERLAILVTEVAVGLSIPFETTGSTTFRRRKKQAGAEPDKSFYFAQAPQIRGKREISLRTDPPPDLVIEIVHTHHADSVLEIYRRFGVPELWIWEDAALRILALHTDRTYSEVSTSVSLAPLTASDVTSWINRPDDDNLALSWIRDLRRWVQDDLLTRRNA